MKQFQAFLAAVLSGLVFSFAAQAATDSSNAGFATVVRVEGIVSYSLGDDKWHPLVAGKILPMGAIVRTDYNGVVDIVLGKDINLPQSAVQGRWSPGNSTADASASKIIDKATFRPTAEQNVIRLTPDTTLGIDKLTIIDTGADTVSDTELNLTRGKIFASVKKLNAASQYLIKLPSGIAGVRGTRFSISVDGVTAVFDDHNHPSRGVVLSLIFPNGTTQTFVIVPGQLLDPATGAPAVLPSALVSILTAVFSALPTTYSPLEYSTENNNQQCYISPTQGAHPPHHHGGGEGGGGGGGGGN
jgi:hypothetical protein